MLLLLTGIILLVGALGSFGLLLLPGHWADEGARLGFGVGGIQAVSGIIWLAVAVKKLTRRSRNSRRSASSINLKPDPKQTTLQPSLFSPEFERFARRLNALPFRDSTRYFYEAMSGGLLWKDEKVELSRSEILWFRCLLGYRGSLLLGEPKTNLELVWLALKKAAPDWPGFRSERCEPNAELAAFLKESKRKVLREFELLSRIKLKPKN